MSSFVVRPLETDAWHRTHANGLMVSVWPSGSSEVFGIEPGMDVSQQNPGVPPDPLNAADSKMHFAFNNTYARLPERFYARANPIAVRAPRLIQLNLALARRLGLDPEALTSATGIAILAGNQVPPGSEPLALAYAGHQFGHFVPQLGDGRAHLLGEVLGTDGLRYDIQLKGSGPTSFSRRGDGRAALGPVLREYLVSEAMAALGVPTTRALAAVLTGEQVQREVAMPGAILTRVASSHLRIGTFQYFAAQNDMEAIRQLADYAITRHYPEAALSRRPYISFLDGVIGRHAELVARWMLLGFIHGVMNTDNTSISGETIDYGPCAFMEAYHPDTVFSSIDQRGRYAYSNQPHAVLWNLTRLAESLLPLLTEEAGSEEGALAVAREALGAFGPRFEQIRAQGLRQKLGLLTELKGDSQLAEDLLARMAANQVDFNLLFYRLINAASHGDGDQSARCLFDDPTAYDAWAVNWRRRLALETQSVDLRKTTMSRVNPAVIPRNHLVADVIDAAVQRLDFQPFEELLKVVSEPYTENRCEERYRMPATSEQRIVQTFCGT